MKLTSREFSNKASLRDVVQELWDLLTVDFIHLFIYLHKLIESIITNTGQLDIAQGVIKY